MIKLLTKKIIKKIGYKIEKYSYNNEIKNIKRIELSGIFDLSSVINSTLEYVDSLKVYKNSELHGYKFAHSCKNESLYGVIAALLLKHLLGYDRSQVIEEICLVKKAQLESGLFYDENINTPMAECEDWWGWRHLTLHALMALGLYNESPKYESDALPELSNESSILKLIEDCDWGDRVAFTSNRLQNFGVMLQFARDFQNSSKSKKLIEIYLEKIKTMINPSNGMFGNMPCKSNHQISQHVQAAYHFWLLYDYDKLDIPYFDQAIKLVLSSQNICGGFGVNWNSSCCEDIDSIDPIYRYSRSNGGSVDNSISLKLGITSIVRSLNPDGGFVFRRGESLRYGDSPANWANVDESCIFFTWFRVLSLAYALKALNGKSPIINNYEWNWGRSPGHQFL
jgi:hypothetical protein